MADWRQQAWRAISTGVQQGWEDCRWFLVFFLWSVPAVFVMDRIDGLIRHLASEREPDALDWCFMVPAFLFAGWRAWIWKQQREEK